MVNICKCVGYERVAFSIEISFTKPFYFHWLKHFKLWRKRNYQ